MIQKTFGVKEIQDVFLTKQGLIEKTAKPNKEQLERNLNAINAFKQNYPELNVGFVTAPNAVSIKKESLPKYAVTLNQDKQIDNIYSKLDDSIVKIDLQKYIKKNTKTNTYIIKRTTIGQALQPTMPIKT